MPRWEEQAVFYHIYPLGFCGAPAENNQQLEVSRSLIKLLDWIPHLCAMGITAVYFGPIFESSSHGYDQSDYTKIDRRLGTNEDFKQICEALHKKNIKVVLDGIFNHVGREFFAFQDVKNKRQNSCYKDWFINVNFNGDSPYGDGFSYEGWEGHYNLVKLNLRNPSVKEYLFTAVENWIKEFGIDGIRLDVAYCLDESFIYSLRELTDRLAKMQDKTFWLMGEMIHGDYNRLLKPGMLHSVTNYECYKGIYSSHNDKNYFEIDHSLKRLFARGGLYEGKYLYNFVDNHDVSRLVSILKEKQLVYNVYTLLFTMPGIPSIYYGSEWKIEGMKERGSDWVLRPCLDLKEMQSKDQSLVEHISQLAHLKQELEVLNNGIYEEIVVKNEQLVFARNNGKEIVYTALNLSDQPVSLLFNVKSQEKEFINLLKEEEKIPIDAGKCNLHLEAFEAKILSKNREDKDLKEKVNGCLIEL